MRYTNIPDTYLKDGLKYCKKCETPREAVIELPGVIFGADAGTTVTRTVTCLCKCLTEERDKQEAEDERMKRQYKIDRMIETGYHDTKLRKYTFAKADVNSEHIEKARQYVDRFTEFKTDGIGLMMYGDVGNGKTFMAACIANALIDKLVPVCMTNTSKILGMEFAEREYFIRNLDKYQLLIIDDFGIERETSYATEQIYNIINERYKSGLPLIVTTNLMPSAMDEEIDINKKRIYSRVKEMCMPLRFAGGSRREALRKQKLAEARKIFS